MGSKENSPQLNTEAFRLRWSGGFIYRGTTLVVTKQTAPEQATGLREGEKVPLGQRDAVQYLLRWNNTGAIKQRRF
ncbi:hypothetical protein EYF80_018083 [Liparis tanakae]|uniref:Uncharacterized protein n=1 Tax=Liparis tanakae TaxID=230148 RepID=A0A4Z2I3A2_9TELE|nr:hypothetical protein EYF80_018083 [Liparis tanakae]